MEKALRRTGKVLLVLDNLESVDDPQVMAFLRDLPSPVKAVATMRFHEDMPYPMRLTELHPQAARKLVIQECEARGIALEEQAMERLLTYTRGMPLAIWWAIGLVAMEGYTVESTLDQLAGRSDLQRFIFGEALARLRTHWPEALEVLLALTFFDLDGGAIGEALAATVDQDISSVQQALQRLLNFNLVTRHQSGGRFTMLPLTRDFAQQELTPEWEQAARERWSDFYIQYVELYGDDDLGEEIGGGIIGYREKLQEEIDNLRLAIDWCFVVRPEKAVRLVERITTFLLDEGKWSERLNLCRRALEVAKTPNSLAGLLTRLGWSYLVQGEYTQAREAQEKGLKIAYQYGLWERLVQLLRDLGYLYSKQGDYDEAYRLYSESLDLAKRIGQEIGILLAKLFCARTAYASGRYLEAKLAFLESLVEPERSHHPRDIASTLIWLGEIAISERKFDEARSFLQEASECIRESYYGAQEETLLYQSLGDLESATHHLDKAQVAYEKALDLATRLGMRKEIERLHTRIQEIDVLTKNFPDR